MSDIGEIRYVPIDHLSPNPLQPRGSISTDSLEDLVLSIKQHGILEPLVAADTPAGLQIIAGERRWRASKLAGLTEVPVIIKKTTPKGMLEMALVENVQRTDLNPLERAKAFDRLVSEFGLTTGEIAQRIGKSSAYVSNSLRLLTIPDALKDGLLTGLITEGHARALSAIEDDQMMLEAYKIILKKSGTVREAEDLARRMQDKAELKTSISPESSQLIISEDTDRLTEDLLNKFKSVNNQQKNLVKVSRSMRETKIIIHLKGDIDQTHERLQMIYQGIMDYSPSVTESNGAP